MTETHNDPPILGLDLGTSTCLASVVRDGAVKFIQPDHAYWDRRRDMLDFPGEIMPSVFFYRDGRTFVGHRALEALKESPRNAPCLVQAVKQYMHRDTESIPIGGRLFSPSQVTGEYVKVLVRAAEVELGLPAGTLRRAVVTVPASFGPREQQATIRACTDYGGLREVELVDEPVAAAISLGLHEQPGSRRVLVADLGGGTFDVALWEVGRDAGPFGFRELGRNGDTRLGGLDWDREIAEWAFRALRPPLTDADHDRLLRGPTDFGHISLFRACQDAKLTLSLQMKKAAVADPARRVDTRHFVPLHVAFLPSYEKGEAELAADMDPDAFLRRDAMLMKQCVRVCESLFHDVDTLLRRTDRAWRAHPERPRFSWRDLDCVYLAGGGSRLPTVQRKIAECAGRQPVLDNNPQHAVAKGAGLLAEKWRQGMKLPGVVGRTRYRRTIGLLVRPRDPAQGPKFLPLIPSNQELPFETTQPFGVAGDHRLRQLTMRFAEQEFHHNGLSHQELAALQIQDLPPAPAPGGAEEALVTVRCGLDLSPSFEVKFRGQNYPVNLKPHLDRERDTPGTNGNGHANSGTWPGPVG